MWDCGRTDRPSTISTTWVLIPGSEQDDVTNHGWPSVMSKQVALLSWDGARCNAPPACHVAIGAEALLAMLPHVLWLAICGSSGVRGRGLSALPSPVT